MNLERQNIAETNQVRLEELYSLQGLLFAAEGEKMSLSLKGRDLAADKMGAIGRDRFVGAPVSSTRFNLVNGKWQSNSWVVEMTGFDESVFELVPISGMGMMRILEVEAGLTELSGSSKMLEVMFNEGDRSINIKRILLPQDYVTAVDEWLNEPWIFEETKMPEVFIEAWHLLGVGEVNREWDKRVVEILTGNRRDIDKQIEYKVIGKEKWLVDEQGEKVMWGGFLSGADDIDRFLIEEKGLADLAEAGGGVVVTKYNHSDGGAVSAATAGDKDEAKEPQVVGDIQVVDKDGKIHQAAVEGGASEIDGLIDKKLGEMLGQSGGVEMVKQVFEPRWIREWMLPIAGLPLDESGVKIPEWSLDKVKGVKKTIVKTKRFEIAVVKFNSQMDELEREKHGDTVLVDEASLDEVGKIIDLSDKGDDGETDWPIDSSEELDDQDDDQKPDLPDNGGGGGLEVNLIQRETEGVIVAGVLKTVGSLSNMGVIKDEIEEQKEQSEKEGEIVRAVDEINVAGVEKIRMAEEQREEGIFVSQRETVWAADRSDQVVKEAPVFDVSPDLKPVEIPVWQDKEMVDFNLSLPVLKAEEWLTKGAEMMFRERKWLEFEYLEESAWIVLITLLAMVDTNLPQPVVRKPLMEDVLVSQRGSGLNQKARAMPMS